MLPSSQPGLKRPSAIRLLGIAATLVVLIAACASNLPPISEAPTATHIPGKFVWHTLFTDDPAAARRFYGDLLGWEFEDIGDGGTYTLIRAGGRPMGAMALMRPTPTLPDVSQWVSFMSVADVDEASALCRNGGSVYGGPADLKGLGRIAVVADPQGAPLGLIRSEIGDPADGREPQVGEFLWRDYVAGDLESAFAFYRQLAGYDHREYEPGYELFVAGGKERAGIFKSPWPNVTPNWLPYVRVADASAAAAKARSLGGEIILEPQPDVRNASTAIVTDPTGAAIALQKYPF
jgi:predicted enzyme related to lactoylglutathione lyase